MKLSSACVHALHALTYLARNPQDGPVTSQAVAAAVGLSASFLNKVPGDLTSSGLIRSERDKGGGYRLARPARSITLLDVVEAVDQPVRGEAPTVGVGEGRRLDGRLQEVCDRVAETVRRRLRGVSLANLADDGSC
jgi:Rrf2 family protein